MPSHTGSASGLAQVAVEQATASINQTTRERFHAAQTMLEKALADDPDDVDLQAALAALQLRGIQMVWYSAEDRDAVMIRGAELLKTALALRPGATADNIGPPTENTSPVFLAAAARVRQDLIDAGLPAR